MSADVVRLHVIAETAPAALARLDGVVLVPAPPPDGVVLSAAPTVAQALAAHPPRFDGPRMVVMADTFTRDDVVSALRAGVRTLLRTAGTTTAQLSSALHAVRDGDGRMPHEVLVQVLGGAATPGHPTPRLTTHQVAVLRLVADGLGNAAIADALSCSEHTVKNVIYEVMSRLHARNRAHAVAAAVRQGLI